MYALRIPNLHQLTGRFPEYDVSIWIDGNFGIQDDINKAVTQYLEKDNMAIFDHTKVWDSRDCIYQEAQAIFHLGQKNNGNYKDNPEIIKTQMEGYLSQGYPANNGLIVSGILFRRHNEQDVIDTMNIWWEEVKYNSKRDQLSFNYAAWKTGIKLYWLDHDIRENTYFFHPGKHPRNKENMYAPISLEYFLNMELQPGGGGKEICLNNKTLRTVREVVEFWKDKNNIIDVQSKLTPKNWQYFNCMIAGFKKGVADHHKIGWEALSKDYYEQLQSMTDSEIAELLQADPVEFDNGFIKHGTHRAYAMIGRLIRGESYIPFWMPKLQIYDTPRVKDGIHRIKPLTDNVVGINEILKLGIPKSEFTICQSGILSLMGIRSNSDIDIVISSWAREHIFNNTREFLRFGNVEIFEPSKSKLLKFGALCDDDLISKFSLTVNEINFLEPRFYFSRKIFALLF